MLIECLFNASLIGHVSLNLQVFFYDVPEWSKTSVEKASVYTILFDSQQQEKLNFLSEPASAMQRKILKSQSLTIGQCNILA